MDETLPLYILAGGRSRRFGADKARATLDGQPLVVRVADRLGPAVSSVRVVGRRDGQYDDLGLTTVPDRAPDLGPLGGLEAALADRLDREGPGWVALASCDWLSPEPGWIEALVAAIDEAPAVVFIDAQGVWQPLPGVVHTDLLPAVSEALASSGRSLWRFLQAAGAHAIPLPRGRTGVEQANTPAQLDAFDAARRGDGSG